MPQLAAPSPGCLVWGLEQPHVVREGHPASDGALGSLSILGQVSLPGASPGMRLVPRLGAQAEVGQDRRSAFTLLVAHAQTALGPDAAHSPGRRRPRTSGQSFCASQRGPRGQRTGSEHPVGLGESCLCHSLAT